MDTLVAGVPGRATYSLYDYDGTTALEDSDVTSLTYSVYDVTNDAEIRASTAIPTTATGTIDLAVLDTQINGTGEREKRRLCLDVNDGGLFCGITFYVAGSACESS